MTIRDFEVSIENIYGYLPSLTSCFISNELAMIAINKSSEITSILRSRDIAGSSFLVFLSKNVRPNVNILKKQKSKLFDTKIQQK